MDLIEWPCDKRTFPADATRGSVSRSEMPYPSGPFMLWLDLWCAAREFVAARGCRVFPIQFSSFVDPDALEARAKAMGLAPAIRSGLRHIFSLLPAHVEWGWSCEEAPMPQLPFVVNLQCTLEAARKVSAMVWASSPTAAGDEDAVQRRVFDETAYFAHNVVPFLPVGDGDYIVLDERDHRVKYWSHEHPRQPVAELGESFVSFMTVWSLFQCPELDNHSPGCLTGGVAEPCWLRVLKEPGVYSWDLLEMWGRRAMVNALPPRWALRYGGLPPALDRWWWYMGPDAMRAHRGCWTDC